MRINNYPAGPNTYKLASAKITPAQSIEKPNTSASVSKTGDDSAALSVTATIRAQLRGLEQTSKAVQEDISNVQSTQGALNQTESILRKLRDAHQKDSTEAKTQVDVTSIEKELNDLVSAVDRIATRRTAAATPQTAASGSVASTPQTTSAGETQSNTDEAGRPSTAPSTAETTAETETAASPTATASSAADRLLQWLEALRAKYFRAKGDEFGAAQSASANLVAGQSPTASSPSAGEAGDGSASGASGGAVAQQAAPSVSSLRADVTTNTQRLERTIRNLDVINEGLAQSDSRTRDADMAKQMEDFTNSNRLTQAAGAMLARANQQPVAAVVHLLR